VLLWFEAVSWHDELIASLPATTHIASLSLFLAKYLPPSLPPFCVLVCRSHALSLSLSLALSCCVVASEEKQESYPALKEGHEPERRDLLCHRVWSYQPRALASLCPLLSLVLSSSCVCVPQAARVSVHLCACALTSSLARLLACVLLGLRCGRGCASTRVHHVSRLVGQARPA